MSSNNVIIQLVGSVMWSNTVIIQLVSSVDPPTGYGLETKTFKYQIYNDTYENH